MSMEKVGDRWKNNKKIYVMSPSQLHHCKYPNAEYPHVEHVEWHGYDIINYGEINEFNKSKNKFIG